MFAVKRKTKWYILVNDKQLGPFSLEELKKREDITPFTQVKARGEKEWVVAAKVPQLQSLFISRKRSSNRPLFKPLPDEIITMPSQRFVWWLWFSLVLFVVVYLLVGMYERF